MSEPVRRTPIELSLALATQFGRVALTNIVQEYPNKLDHVCNSAHELLPPRALHPIFFGSYDWHSAVHMHWLLVRLLRLYPQITDAPLYTAALNRQFTPAHVSGEMAYLDQPSRATFERTYGWSWLLKLYAEVTLLADADPRSAVWRDALAPLAQCFVQRYLDYLPLAQYPIRAGTHANSAFGLLFALDYARQFRHVQLAGLIVERAQLWFGADRAYPAGYEPGGDDFLSGGLVEATLMQQVLGAAAFPDWWAQFCPPPSGLDNWLTPVIVSDRRDPKLSHLDGLNLSRAWCWRRLKTSISPSLGSTAERAITAHLAASLPHIADGHYVGTHWLASFATLALTEH